MKKKRSQAVIMEVQNIEGDKNDGHTAISDLLGYQILTCGTPNELSGSKFLAECFVVLFQSLKKGNKCQ
jgi:hypothetical protein